MTDLLQLLPDGTVILQQESLLIQEFHTLYYRDKTKGHLVAISEFTFIFLMTHPNSPLFNLPTAEKELQAIRDSFGKNSTWKPDEDVRNALQRYEQLIETPVLRFLKGAKELMEDLTVFMRDKNNRKFNERNIKIFADILAKGEQIMQSYRKLEKLAKTEFREGGRRRKAVQPSIFDVGT